jgi:hypothetical protein
VASKRFPFLSPPLPLPCPSSPPHSLFLYFLPRCKQVLYSLSFLIM